LSVAYCFNGCGVSHLYQYSLAFHLYHKKYFIAVCIVDFHDQVNQVINTQGYTSFSHRMFNQAQAIHHNNAIKLISSENTFDIL
jgi:hypothetical protein